MITFTCPGCRKRLKGPPAAAGRSVKCPLCGRQFTASADASVVSVRLPLQPVEPGQVAFPEPAAPSAARDLEAGTPIKSLHFSAPHACLGAEHEDSHSAWERGSWQPKAVDWLPPKHDVRAALSRAIANLEDVFLEVLADGRYLKATGFERSDTPASAKGGFGWLATATQTRKVSALWDCASREWACAVTNARIVSTSFAFGVEHVALLEGGGEMTIRVARRRPGQPLDLAGAPCQIRTGEIGHVLFLGSDQGVACAGYMPSDASKWAAQSLAVYAVRDGRKLWTGQFLPPKPAACPPGGSWSFHLLFQEPSGIFAFGQAYDFQKRTAAAVLFDALSGELLCEPWTPPMPAILPPALLARLGLICWIREGNVLELRHLPSGRTVFEEPLSAKPTRVAAADGRHLALQFSETRLRVYELAI